MKIKQPIIIMAALALSVSVQAQSLEEGIKMYNYERYQTAKKVLTPLAGTNPLANYYLGLTELQMGNKEAAKTIFQKNPDNYANMSGLARVSFAEGKTTEGNQLAAAIAAKARKKEWEQLKYAADAITYTNGGNYQQAIDWYKTALANYDNMDMRISLADAYQKLGSGGGGEAMTNYEKVIEKDAKNSLVYSRIGKLWYEAKTYKLALENWEKAKEADPVNPIPYRDLADAYTYVGKYDLAKQNLEKYLEYSDKTDEDMEKYMDILFLSKNYKDAVVKANDLLVKGKTDARYYGILAFSQYELKDSVNALKNANIYFQKQNATKIYPNDYRQYGRILLQNGKAEDADRYFEKAVEIDSSKNKSEAYRDNAEALRMAREWKRAGGWYNKLINAYPDNAKALDYFYSGNTAYYGKDYAGAATAYELMETKFPDQPSATYWRGRVGAAVDSEAKTGMAIPYYTKWLEIPGYDRKPNDLTQAYRYMLVYYYNKDDKANADKYLELLRAIDANDPVLKQIESAKKSGTSKSPTKK